MPLDEQQKEDTMFEVAALRKKLQECNEELSGLKAIILKAQADVSNIYLLKAKLARANEVSGVQSETWDRLIFLHIKLGTPASFPKESDIIGRIAALEVLDEAKALEMSMGDEHHFQSQPSSRNDSKATIPLLGKIKLPHFDGSDVRDWARFRDVFSSMVDHDVNLDPVTKLYLLRDSLSGEALSTVNKFDVTDANYQPAWEALVEAYDNPRVLGAAYLEQILKFKMPNKPTLPDYQSFLTSVVDSVSAFRALRLRDAEDKIIALIMLRSLDAQTRHKFELSHGGSDFPSVDQIARFIRNQCQALKLSGSFPTEPTTNSVNQGRPRLSAKGVRSPVRSSPNYRSFVASSAPSHTQRPPKHTSPRRSPSKRNSNIHTSVRKSENGSPLRCSFCQERHILSRCPIFLSLSLERRLDFVSKWNGCRNCLNPDHRLQDCRSRYTCRICNERHNTLLHPIQRASTNDHASGSSGVLCGHADSTHHRQTPASVSVVLGTARAAIRDSRGKLHFVRLLLDSGSQQSFVTQSVTDRLGLKVRPTSLQVTGLGEKDVTRVTGLTNLTLMPIHQGRRLKMSAAVLTKIAAPVPRQPIPERVAKHFRNMQLADPRFHEPQEVDILLGADYYDQVVTGLFHKSDPSMPATLPTIFGSVIMGSYTGTAFFSVTSLKCQVESDLSDQLQAFWELEEPSPASRESPSDAFCEDHFLRTHTRDSTGRYIVRLPFSAESSSLGDNKATARRRFQSLEARMRRDEVFRQDYRKFMQEYETLGHMEIAKSPSSYVIPHFGIMQNKLRVVFDASCPSSTTSLNEMLLPGPKLQTDICDVLLSFRMFPIAITTDLVKMYRQILLHPDDRRFQHIFWRDTPEDRLLEYQLNTVTYGEAPSAFLAIRTVLQLMRDEGHQFPLVIRRLLKAIFVDDICTGADTEEEAIFLCQQLIKFFARGGFSLSKWASNRPTVLPRDCETADSPLALQPENSAEIKVLGLVWSPKADTFSYTVQPLPEEAISTKRTMLSFIARMFDPLGFLAPVVFSAKCLMQEAWKSRLEWDTPLPEPLASKWYEITRNWNDLSRVRIPRYTSSRHRVCNFVGFCDASTRGYAAALYLHVQYSNDDAEAFLIKAKTKVAPVNFVSVARLELCGALLLARLISSIELHPDLQIHQNFLFCDSQVALAWINTPTHLLRVFEANRVAAIKELLPDADWRYVESAENPADLASRGLMPSQIADCKLWWNGPDWLKFPPDQWAVPVERSTALPADSLEPTISMIASAGPSTDCTWIERFSSFSRLIRTVTRMLRFARRSLVQVEHLTGPLTAAELNHATLICARTTQRHLLPKGLETPELAPLSPFLDELGILRVGGRLQNSPLSFDARHPIIIPRKSHLAYLIVQDIHNKYYHSGPTLTLALLRSKFWITSAMRFIKGQISKCVTCFKRRPKGMQAIMAPLPASRFALGRPFLQTGVDYAGPFSIRDSLRRKSATTKAYLCLFICFTTKAVHLDAVTSLSTEAFLATLDRFIARRGKPAVIHSDNATNFAGASRYLKELTAFLLDHRSDITDHLAQAGIEWRFIPPRSPSFGGLWEAGVKSAKSLLSASIAPQSFTYEELSTILARIESVLNSRPLCPLSDDPDSFNTLTPGHFLIGAPLCSLPEEDVVGLPENRLSRWQMVQKNVQHLWQRWQREYLHTLQQRTKWSKEGSNLRPGDLVVLLEKITPCGYWPLARVTDVHPGTDGVVRVVMVKTPSGTTFKRSIHRLARLPLPTEDSSTLPPQDPCQ